MRRAIVVIALALTMLVAAACPVIAAVAQPSPTERVDRVDFNGDGFDDLAIGVPVRELGGRPWPVPSTFSMAEPVA